MTINFFDAGAEPERMASGDEPKRPARLGLTAQAKGAAHPWLRRY